MINKLNKQSIAIVSKNFYKFYFLINSYKNFHSGIVLYNNFKLVNVGVNNNINNNIVDYNEKLDIE
jgi:hypothetical protein